MASLRSVFSFSTFSLGKRSHESEKNGDKINPILSSSSLNSFTFSCVLADERQEKSIELVNASPKVAELYEKIAAAFDITQEQIHFCTLNTPQRNLFNILKSQIRSNDVIFIHLRGATHYVSVIKDKAKLGLFLTDDERGNVFVISLQRELQILPFHLDAQIANHSGDLDIVQAVENRTMTNHAKSQSQTGTTIEVGDQILSVNGKQCTGKTHNFVSNIIRNAPLKEKLSIMLRKPKEAGDAFKQIRTQMEEDNQTSTNSLHISSSVNPIDNSLAIRPKVAKRCSLSTSSHTTTEDKLMSPTPRIDDYLLRHLGIQDPILRSQIHSLGLKNRTNFARFSSAIQLQLKDFYLEPNDLRTLWHLFLPPPSSREIPTSLSPHSSSTVPGSTSRSSSYLLPYGDNESRNFDPPLHKPPYSILSSPFTTPSSVTAPRSNQTKSSNVSAHPSLHGTSANRNNPPLQPVNLLPLPHKKHRQTASLGSINFTLTQSTDETNVIDTTHHKTQLPNPPSSYVDPLNYLSEKRTRSTSQLSTALNNSTSSYHNPNSPLSESYNKLPNKLSFVNVPHIKNHLEARSRSHPSLVGDEVGDSDVTLASPSSKSREHEYAATLASRSNKMFNKVPINPTSSIPFQQKLKPSRWNMALPPHPSSPGRNSSLSSSVANLNKDSRSLSYLSLMNETVSSGTPEKTSRARENRKFSQPSSDEIIVPPPGIDPPIHHTKQRQKPNHDGSESIRMTGSIEFSSSTTDPPDKDILVLKCRVSTEV